MPFVISLLTWFAGSYARKFAINTALFAAYVTASIAATAALFLALKGLINAIYVATPQVILNIWAWFIPPSFSNILLAVITAHILKYLFQMRSDFTEKYLDSHT